MRIFITGGSGFIGTNLIEYYARQHGTAILNYDWNPPLNPDQTKYWWEDDIMDYRKLRQVMVRFQPDIVIHLAARTDTDIYDLDGDMNEYIQNTEGTRRLLQAIKSIPSIQRVIMTSTQFVCEAGYKPMHDKDYKPFTLYGKSKLISEQLTREANLPCCWTIIRPSTIWGPWALRYRDIMFKVMKKGLYFHPAKKGVQRSYGYVKNVIHQIDQILKVPAEQVNGETFYVGDEPIDLLEWVKTISQQLTGNPVRILPTSLVKAIALTGDLASSIGVPFPLTSTRFNSMTQDYVAPMEKTLKVLGPNPYSMEAGAKEMVEWYYDRSAQIEKPSPRYYSPEELSRLTAPQKTFKHA